MKKITKILSVFMALVMVFSCVQVSVVAADRDTTSLDAYLDNENLAVIIETLLTDLNDRKETIVPTVFGFVFMLDQLKNQAAADGVDVATATTEDYATVLLNYLDAVLAEEDLNGQLAGDSTMQMVMPLLKGYIGDLDLNSVDGILSTLVGVINTFNEGKSRTWGTLASFDNKALVTGKKNPNPISRENASDLDIVYALLEWLADNAGVLKTAVKGELSLGSIGGMIKNLGYDIEAMVNDAMGSIDSSINKELYNNLLADRIEVDNGDGTTSEQIEVAFEESIYKDFTSDELLGASLVKAIKGGDVDQQTASETAKMTMGELLGTYGDYVIGSFLIDPLNNDLKTALTDLINDNADLAILKDIINLNFEFTVSDFNFTALAKNGIFEGLNDLVCGIIEKLVQPAVAKELALKKGGNENITANLTSFFAYILKTLATNNGGKVEFTVEGTAYSYDFSGFTADKLATMNLEEMIIEVLRLFAPSVLGSDLPSDIDSLENVVLAAAYGAIDTYMVKAEECDFTTDFKDLVYNADGTVKDLSYSKWADTMGTMGMEVAVYWLNRANVGFDMSPEQYAAFAESGWTWEDYLEDIVDWALGYIKGFPAVADELSIERGVKDGYGAWYKLNVVINELFALNFINGCGDETFVVDFYSLFVEKISPSMLDCDFAAFADVLSMNDDPESLFNQSVISGIIGLVDNLLFSIFEHNCGETATFTKEATATHDGYSGSYCVDNGHYTKVTVTPATGETEPDEPTTQEPETQPPTTQPPEVQVPDTKPPVEEPEPPAMDGEPTVMLGDITGDEKITASDARKALRHSAGLDVLEGNALLAADVTADGKVTASDARKILRHSAGLDVIVQKEA